MNITLNGKKEKLGAEISVQKLLSLKKITPAGTAVLLNGEIIKKEFRAKTMLKNGDKVEIITFVGGG
ncbi:MAG: sulfur carrier protein ThiS [Elusimicrobia bacterium]|nr:sulfur carrier protein ThiS [Elusimicrobiota bacterium]